MSDFILPNNLDDFFQTSPIGSIEKAQAENFYGFNHGQVASALPMNKDTYGLTFFVRPQLNMQADNLQNHRIYYSLLTDNPLSMQRIVRCSLDPRLQYGYSVGKYKINPIDCPMVDPECAFFPDMTNQLTSISGWPDMTLPTFQSKPGLFGEVWATPDGMVENFEHYDVDCNFRNIKGEVILYRMYIWLNYMAHQFRGLVVPYMDMITENEMDFWTRIYRFTLDETKTYVTKAFCSGVSLPISIPFSNMADFNIETPYNLQNKDITIRMKCLGFRAMDPIIIKDFNHTVCTFKPHMYDNYRDQYMVKIPRILRTLFKGRGYPLINTNTLEMEWWIDKEVWIQRTTAFLKMNSITSEQAAAIQDIEFRGD